MIKVTVELFPYGNKEKRQVIAEAIIVNDGTGGLERGHYDVHLDKQAPIKVRNHLREKGIWALIAQSLKELGITP